MIFSPLPGTPLITQGFGQNSDVYSVWGFAGHNGIDFGITEGTVIYAPHDGVASVVDDGASGYGLYLTITDTKRRSILAHLSEVTVSNGQTIYQGDPVAKSGNSGQSSGPHLHWTYKIMKNNAVQNKSNGYDGAVDVSEFTRLWHDQDLHHDSTYTDFANEYLAMDFPNNVYLENPNRHA
jgi:murein DD-endopeptidase MepM/ murein hydrolase activator NlpD|tara:strand:+ start:513 stop:1052 length:540 start_codon:yes stop_codon:yes gene_type:complete